jgi:hypothetical protein
MEKTSTHKKIKKTGYNIGFLEEKMKIPRNTFYNFVNGSKPLPEKHIPAVKKVLKKFQINLEV